MSAKWKLFLIVVFSIFATAATGVYFTQRQLSVAISEVTNRETQHLSAVKEAHEIVVDSGRTKYKSIPLESINSALQGSDPAMLALNAFDDIMGLNEGTRRVEVAYPYPNHALVTITQTTRSDDVVKAVRYRVELTTFGRSLLVSSPYRMWEIVWAGSQEICKPGNSPRKMSNPTLSVEVDTRSKLSKEQLVSC